MGFGGRTSVFSTVLKPAFISQHFTPEVMRRGHETDHSPTFNAVVHIMWPMDPFSYL